MGEVITTKDYSIFKFLKSNRKVGSHKRLKESLVDHGQLTPIVVNKDMFVVDGQHRVALLQELGKPVDYIIYKDRGIEDLAAINSTAKLWTIDDYLHHYASLGNQNYLDLIDFLEEQRFDFNILKRLCNMSGGGGYALFKIGKFVFKKTVLTETVEKYKDFSRCDGFGSLAFAGAVNTLLRNSEYDHKHMKEKLSQGAGNIRKSTSSLEYVRQLSGLYNRSKKERVLFTSHGY